MACKHALRKKETPSRPQAVSHPTAAAAASSRLQELLRIDLVASQHNQVSQVLRPGAEQAPRTSWTSSGGWVKIHRVQWLGGDTPGGWVRENADAGIGVWVAKGLLVTHNRSVLRKTQYL